jgi:hypothetical protein
MPRHHRLLYGVAFSEVASIIPQPKKGRNEFVPACQHLTHAISSRRIALIANLVSMQLIPYQAKNSPL